MPSRYCRKLHNAGSPSTAGQRGYKASLTWDVGEDRGAIVHLADAQVGNKGREWVVSHLAHNTITFHFSAQQP